MTHIWTNNGLLHPVRALKFALRRWLSHHDNADPEWTGGPVPAFLEPFAVGESLPWKGISFKIGKIVGGDFPLLILVPVDVTHGAKLKKIRDYRDLSRHARDLQAATSTALRGNR